MPQTERRKLSLAVRGAFARVLVKGLQSLRSLAYSGLSQNRVLGRPKRMQPVQAMGMGRIECEPGVVFGYFPSPYWSTTIGYLEARKPSAHIRIGSGTTVGNNVCLIAESTSISIGRNCLIGANVVVFDSDFHALSVAGRRNGERGSARPVVIEDDVFIAQNVSILKGVLVGRGAVVASGSVVTRNVPAGAVVAGTPARVVGVADTT